MRRAVDGMHHTTCPMDCPDSCALVVEVEEGKVGRIGGRLEHPDTGGFICSKVAKYSQRVYHPDRILHPLRRVGRKGEGRFERLSWDDAIAEIVERFTELRDRWGGESILPFHYNGSNGMLTDGLIDALFFQRLGSSRLELNICAAPTTAVAVGMYGKMPGVAFADYCEAECIVIWGANPKASNIHLAPYLLEAKRRGAFIAAVDPRRNFSLSEIDLHLPVRPGTDLPVALAMIGKWRQQGALAEDFLDRHSVGRETLLTAADDWPVQRAAEVAGVEAAQIERLAEVYARSQPALIRCGWGLERNRNGGQAVAAILSMPALLGKFGCRGGGYTMSNSGATRFAAESLVGETEDSRRRRLNMTQLARWLQKPLEPPVQGLFVYNSNPVATVPDQNGVIEGLRRSDLFTVVFDQVMTDTAAYADLVLPAVTFLEGHDLRAGYGSYVLGAVRPVIPPQGEARTNTSVFSQLARAMGFDDAAFRWSEQDLFERAVAAVELNGEQPKLETLRAGQVEQHRFEGDGESVFEGSSHSAEASHCPVQFDTVWPRTPSRKVDLSPRELGATPYRFEQSEKRWPLAMISPATSKTISSSMGEYNLDRLTVALHPEDAMERAIEAGSKVRVFNEMGEVHCVARVDERVRPGVVAMAKGAWRKSSLNGSTPTALCPDHLNVVANGACFNDARVDVELLPPA